MKHKARIKYKRFKSTYYYDIFAMLRTRVKVITVKCYENYIKEVENYIPNNTQKFWSYISKVKKSNMLNTMNDECVSTNDGMEIVNNFADYFNSVFIKSSDDPFVADANALNSMGDTLPHITVDTAQVSEVIGGIDPAKGAGYDNIPVIFIKNCSVSLSAPLTIIFNKSLSEGCFPTYWKKGMVVPIFKNGDRCRLIITGRLQSYVYLRKYLNV